MFLNSKVQLAPRALVTRLWMGMTTFFQAEEKDMPLDPTQVSEAKKFCDSGSVTPTTVSLHVSFLTSEVLNLYQQFLIQVY